MRSRYPIAPRANLGRGFWGCHFCGGSGCLACQQQAKRQYDAAFPDGPRPILTITAQPSPDLTAMQDDGCPNIPSPDVFPPPDGDDFISTAVRHIIAALPINYNAREE